MNVFMVYAHQDSASFGAAMHNRALNFFEKQSARPQICDLYGSGFQAVAAKWDFKTSGGAHHNYQSEQQRAATATSDLAFAEDIKAEVERLRAADLVVFEFPVWWSSCPAIMKGWFDKVFALGIVWDSEHRYETGLLRGKQAVVIASAGEPEQNYTAEGVHKATLTQHLYPLLHSTIAHAGMDVLTPFYAYDLTVATDGERDQKLQQLDAYLAQQIQTPTYLYKHA